MLKSAVADGYVVLMIRWVNAIQFCWGGWLLFNYPNHFGFEDFLRSNFALVLCQFGLGSAFAGLPDQQESQRAVNRLFALLDRESKIDPLSQEGEQPRFH